ncbi:amidase [Kitasatospora sp. MMS16-BH015]|uniref:amidase n=1 Tax=Kitasatospora sp. MMS16-BH015 TaxID=2018025 RepID=UPI000CA382DD|nr:amidase [Kitasatospora sp. MMS16-BH015]AUG78766.1 amidase [Kitasatospora sp. MMS16-BH015]
MEPLIHPVPLRTGHPEEPGYVDRLCTRIDRVDPVVQAFVPEPGRYGRLTAEAAGLVRATALATAGPGPLYGVPVGVKDVIHVDGLPTHGGSALPPGVLTGPEGTAVRRLRAAGALVAGKTTTAEFAVLAPGPTRNPYDLAHTPGGSSSGSAVAVATGLVPLALGTQTVGSMIRPAAYCGVVAYRPGLGRMPVDGVILHAPSLDTLGVFTAELAGAELAAALLCDSWTPVTDPGRPPVLGVPEGPYLDRTHPTARAVFEQQLRALAELGVTVRRVPVMAGFEEVVRDLRTIIRYELAQGHADWFARFGQLYRAETVNAIRLGREFDAADHAAALRARDLFRQQLADTTAAAGLDLWVAPAAPSTAPAGLETTGDAVMSLPWSFAGLPALALPAGRSPEGLPYGLQLIAPAGADERLLALARPLEGTLDRTWPC